ncbi:hypothetical protein IB299_22610 [Vibrio parahaemolyticus]|uniref:hypothetical protein n=1 Tax=Vibrio parahaemolyticus TaxID=670 RepID=UPI001B844A16|nr:hypothetical protein [Vibrio parahaemolyticus]EJG1355486.1 hypothetical protein [Vibrio parahaemolyticus]EJG1611339.1 hypothetical protein [Vibrio parahaemolyticus]MCC3831831.1 hypothetical protein [Vibrio parahaemolyticus]HBC3510899.1 hypothetical protein [Vibrio parahaemolyticus]HBH7855833.1 hypothetical protein [Vibrio parahaemolyticus]
MKIQTKKRSISPTEAGWEIKENTKLRICEVIAVVAILAFIANPLLSLAPIGALFATLTINSKITDRRKAYAKTPFFREMIGKRPHLRVPPSTYYPMLLIGTLAIVLGFLVHGLILDEASGFVYAAIASYFVAKVVTAETLYHLPIWKRIDSIVVSIEEDELKVGEQMELDLDEPSY